MVHVEITRSPRAPTVQPTAFRTIWFSLWSPTRGRTNSSECYAELQSNGGRRPGTKRSSPILNGVEKARVDAPDRRDWLTECVLQLPARDRHIRAWGTVADDGGCGPLGLARVSWQKVGQLRFSECRPNVTGATQP